MRQNAAKQEPQWMNRACAFHAHIEFWQRAITNPPSSRKFWNLCWGGAVSQASHIFRFSLEFLLELHGLSGILNIYGIELIKCNSLTVLLGLDLGFVGCTKKTHFRPKQCCMLYNKWIPWILGQQMFFFFLAPKHKTVWQTSKDVKTCIALPNLQE